LLVGIEVQSGLGGGSVAVGVVDGDLLDLGGESAWGAPTRLVHGVAHLRTGIQKQPADGREYDADDEEEGEDRLGGEDGPVWALLVRGARVRKPAANLLPCLQALLSECRI
jgi:hypothetical protein